MPEHSIYKDIAERTGGDIYIGVVGPVRTGKSTFIKRFMEALVLPNIAEGYSRERARDEMPQSAAGTASSAVALVLATLFSMIFGELVPQFLGISAPLRVGKKVAGPTRVFATVAKPLIAVLNGSANGFLRAVGVEPQEELSAARTPQELASLGALGGRRHAGRGHRP
ncbi:MAG TPA: CNNM domain-containing protein, partial [Bacillota bacterium]|nr:CNNM domain-containing protein [Bacillota bacterium]